jgi:aspartyl protease family protein
MWLGMVGVGVVTFAALSFLFPGQVTGMDATDAIGLLGFLALVSAALVFARRTSLGVVARNAGIWAGLGLGLLVGYSYRAEITGAFQRVAGELIPSMAVASTPHSLTVTAADDGHFYVMGKVNGAPVRFAIDTGASGVLLAPADAERAGVSLSTLKFDAASETANGVGFAAPYTAPTLEVGSIRLTNVPMAVDKTPMSASLLGMSFLKRMDALEFHGDQLVLKWKS